jgi:predicted nucleic acid-binding protein
MVAMKNLTITVDDNVLEWARIEAARRGSSVSRMVGDFLGEMQRREDAYERAYLAWRTDERTWRSTGDDAQVTAMSPEAPRSVSLARSNAATVPNQPSPTLATDALVFVDTSVLVAAEDTSAGALYTQVLNRLDHLWRERTGRVSTQGLTEFYESVTGRAQHPLPQGDARAAIRRYNSWTPWQNDAATLETAWALQARHTLAWGDCLALAAAQHSGCAALLSLHLPEGEQYGGVQVAHPCSVHFAAA